MTKEEKVSLIKQALLSGVPKRKIDIRGRGYSAIRLLSGLNNTDKKIDEMYENLLKFRNKDVEQSKAPAPAKEELAQRVKEQELEITSLKSRLEFLEKAIQPIQIAGDKKRTRKVLGIPITQKTDIVGGRKYVRWYGYTKHNGKRRWIYIGKDLLLAEAKITAWLQKEGLV